MKKFLFILSTLSLFLLTSCRISLFFSSNEGINNKEKVEIENGSLYEFKDNLKNNGPLTTNAFPSIGSPKLLVIPISFDATKESSSYINDIKVAFSGTSEETGYYSVKEFYKESSYGKLNIEPVVLDEFYKPKFSKSYYEGYNTRLDTGSSILLKEALSYYDEKIDYSDYDYDNDGCIDAVWLIYNCSVSFSGDNDFWWAYQTSNLTDELYDNKRAYYYAFAGIDFMYDKKHVSYDPTNIKIDAHTYIHETGHLMGLDDYYDYDESRGLSDRGTYEADMMDSTFGDHGPISKLLLGWITPTVINADYKSSISSFAKTGEVFLITKDFYGTIYDSYYLLVLYDEYGINALDKPFAKDIFGQSGILIYEINAEKNLDSKGNANYNGGSYNTGFKYDNSDTQKKFVRMIPPLNSYILKSPLYKNGSFNEIDYFKVNVACDNLNQYSFTIEFV